MDAPFMPRPHLLIALPLATLVLTLAATSSPGPASAPEAPAQEATATESQLLVLWARDDYGASLDVSTGGSGTVLVSGQLDLSNATVVYDRLKPAHLSFGPGRHGLVALAFLGELETTPRLDPRAQGPRLSASVFHTLRVDRDRIVHDLPGAEGRELRAASEILRRTPERGPIHWEPKVGEIVLVRYLPEGRHRNQPELAKFLVVDHEPGQRLTIRWAPLR